MLSLMLLWAQIGIAALTGNFVNRCNLIAGSKDLFLAGVTPTESYWDKFHAFELIVHLEADGSGKIWSPEDPDRFASFDRVRFSSVTHLLPETIGDLFNAKLAAKHRLDLFYSAQLTGGDAHLQFEHYGSDGTPQVVAELSSIQGQKNSFRGFINLAGSDQKKFSFHHLQSPKQTLFSIPVLTSDGTPSLLVIRTWEKTLTLYGLHSSRTFGYVSTQASVYGELAFSDALGHSREAAELALLDLRTERATVLRFEAEQQLVLELKNFDQEGNWDLISGGFFPRSKSLNYIGLTEDRTISTRFSP